MVRFIASRVIINVAVSRAKDYILQHTNVSCHMPVNVYYEPSALYEVKKDDHAVDIQINDEFR